MIITLLFIGILAACLSLVFVQMAVRTMITHQMIYNALAGVRAQRWDLLVSYTGERSLKWRYYNRRYMRLVGLEARKKISAQDVDIWEEKVSQDQILRIHAAELKGKGCKELEEYLITQYQNDGTLLPARNALVVWIGSSVLLALAIMIVIYAASDLAK